MEKINQIQIYFKLVYNKMKQEKQFLKEFFQNVAKRLGKPYGQLVTFEEELRKNWFDSPEALKGVSDAQYEKMGFPLRVTTAIKEQINKQSQNSTKPTNQNIPRQPDTKRKEKESRSIEQQGKVISQRTILFSTQHLQNGLLLKYKYVCPEFLKIVQTITKIVKNIISDPYEVKFRILKKSNNKIREIVFDHKPVLDFFKQMGFEQDEETLTLDKFQVQHLYFAEECLEAIVDNHRSQLQEFQKPGNKSNKKQYNSSRTQENMFLPTNIKFPQNKESTTLKNAFSKQQINESNYVDLLDKLIAFRDQLMAKCPENRDIKIYHKKYEIKQMQFEEIHLEKQMQKSDDSVLAQYWKNALKNNRNNSNFQSRRKQEFDFLIKQQVYKYTIIKVRLPNQFIIQAKFGPLQPLNEVLKLVADIVIGDIYLYQAPPVKRLDKEMHKTLDNLSSVPTGSFYLGINNEWYIKNEYKNLIRK